MKEPAWEYVTSIQIPEPDADPEEDSSTTRRLRVPSGWIYRLRGTLVFVPDPTKG